MKTGIQRATQSRLPIPVPPAGSMGKLMAALLIAFLVAGNAIAATFTVDSIADTVDSDTSDGICNDGTGRCTLRAALQQANSSGGSNTINVPAGNYLLSVSTLFLTNSTNDVLIAGTGAPGTVIIDGQGALAVERIGQRYMHFGRNR